MAITSATKKMIILLLVLLHYGKDFLMPLAIGGILSTLFYYFVNGRKEKTFTKA